MVKDELIAGLRLLGDLLQQRALHFELVVIGGGALLLNNVVSRPTQDLDAVARVQNGKWHKAKPFPKPLLVAIREVADALGLPREPHQDKDWLNPAPSILLNVGLPPGFAARAQKQVFGGLTLHIAARVDLISLKVWAATDVRRQRRDVDIDDLRALSPTLVELRGALAWCASKDGRVDFFATEGSALLTRLGFEVEGFDDV